MLIARSTLLLLASFVFGVNTYTWPSHWDVLEDAYTITGGSGSLGVLDGVTPCSVTPFGPPGTGRQTAAEWLRIAYHDMATHDVNTGLGGLDASIGFETDRPENIGTAMNTSLIFFAAFQSQYASMSDIMALGAIMAVAGCGGPSIPFKVGRVDATAAGPAGVPQPQEDLASHTASFARQGFNQIEMIGLVACGHTIGGVHQVDFPQTIQGAIAAGNSDGIVHFDNTFDSFDNRIAVSWIDGSSTDPLATGFNQTTNSDARIFAADGNKTMQGFASSATSFSSACGDLLGRMIDTVPKSVSLIEIAPLSVKPNSLQLGVRGDGKLGLTGFIRLFSTSAEAAAAPANTRVVVTWKDRTGAACANCVTTASFDPSVVSTSLWGTVGLFLLNATIDPTLGISAFVVDYSYQSSGALIRANNGGSGFPVQDMIFYQPEKSCIDQAAHNLTISAAVRNLPGGAAPSKVYVVYTFPIAQPGTVFVQMQTTTTPMSISTSLSTTPSSLYTTYTASMAPGPQLFSGIAYFDLVAVVDGETYTDSARREVTANC